MMQTEITIENLQIACIIGVNNQERIFPQQICVNITVQIDTTAVSRFDSIEHTHNYDHIVAQAEFILKQGKFFLLETAGHVLMRWLLAPTMPNDPRPTILSAHLSIMKPAALSGTALAKVDLRASRETQEYLREEKNWGWVDVIAETQHAGFYRLNLFPSAKLPEHYHLQMKESELVLTPGLKGWQSDQDPRILSVGEVFEWKQNQPHGYLNHGTSPASILCVDAPPFDPADERPTQSPS